jgi:antitoxin component of MazEF toxin-antitoxin module
VLIARPGNCGVYRPPERLLNALHIPLGQEINVNTPQDMELASAHLE